jgi:DNA-directed RNA polymerase subunit K/omega
MEEAIRSLDDTSDLPEESVPSEPAEPSPPISSRFLFVDVAALRAKQLRRGARRRFETDPRGSSPIKPERAAMEEVRRGLVTYQVPDQRSWHAEGH